jgi:protein NUD1
MLDLDDDESPTRTGSWGRRSAEEQRPLAARRPNTHIDNSQVSRRVFTRSQTHRMSPHVKVNATFLTECSFAVSHDRLVQVITDVEPFEPYWEEITSIDLSKKNVESVARLKEFLPRLDSLSL